MQSSLHCAVKNIFLGKSSTIYRKYCGLISIFYFTQQRGRTETELEE